VKDCFNWPNFAYDILYLRKGDPTGGGRLSKGIDFARILGAIRRHQARIEQRTSSQDEKGRYDKCDARRYWMLPGCTAMILLKRLKSVTFNVRMWVTR
jgi:hypothetical protein